MLPVCKRCGALLGLFYCCRIRAFHIKCLSSKEWSYLIKCVKFKKMRPPPACTSCVHGSRLSDRGDNSWWNIKKSACQSCLSRLVLMFRYIPLHCTFLNKFLMLYSVKQRQDISIFFLLLVLVTKAKPFNTWGSHEQYSVIANIKEKGII